MEADKSILAIQAIQAAALMLMAEHGVMRKSDLVVQLEAHMTSTEREENFFNVREAVKQLVESGQLLSIGYTIGPASGVQYLIALPGLKIRVPVFPAIAL